MLNTIASSFWLNSTNSLRHSQILTAINFGDHLTSHNCFKLITIQLLYYCKSTFPPSSFRKHWGLWTINIQTVRTPALIYQYEALGRRSGAQPLAYSSSHFLMRTYSYKAQAKQGLSNLVITHSSPPRCGRVIGCLQQRSNLVTPVLTVSLEHSDYAKWIDARARHLGRETEEILNAAPDALRRWWVGLGGENARLDAQRNWLSNL